MGSPADPVAVLVAHQPAMRRLARAIVFDDDLALDVAQDASRIALARPAPAGWAPWAWLAGIVRNAARNALRSERRRREHERAFAAPDVARDPGPREQAARIEEQRRVLGALLRLDAADREVVVLRYLDGLSVDEIAARAKTPRETVRTRLRRAIARLRAGLGAETPAARRALGAALLVSPAPPLSPAPAVTAIGALAMKKVVIAVVAVLLVAVGALAWRLSALTADVERLSGAPGLLASAPTDPAVPSAASAPAMLAPRPATTAPADSDVAARLARIESRLDALATQVADADRVNEDLKSVIAEVVAERIRLNEGTVIGVSRNAISAQAQFQAMAKCDANSNGTGEFGGFVEMSGGAAGRMQAPLNPPVLSGAFRTLTAAGEVTRGGYLYRVFLPDSHGVGVGEPQTGFDRASVDARLSETTWCVYAWPVAYGKTGTRTFFTNQGGDVLATDAAVYSGSGSGPSPDAAFVERGPITGRVAIGAKGSDGNTWTQVN